MVEQLAPTGRLVLLVDDTLVRKSGRKINGVGIFRDVVGNALSTKLVTALGLNVVVPSLRVRHLGEVSRRRCRWECGCTASTVPPRPIWPRR